MGDEPTLTADDLDLTIEQREVAFDDLEVRDLPDGSFKFRGHAAVFDALSEPMRSGYGVFVEQIKRGAFKSVLRQVDGGGMNVRMLLNHNPDHLLATTKAGTMRLQEDPKGLLVEANVAPTSVGRDIKILSDRGDLTGMSMGFRVGRGNSKMEAHPEYGRLRTIRSFQFLRDVGPVTSPAYNQTDLSMRSLVCGVEIVDEEGELQRDLLEDVAWRIHRGEVEATDEERAAIDAAFRKTDIESPWVTQRALLAACREQELRGVIPGKRVSVVLEDDPVGGPVAYRLAARSRRLRALGQAAIVNTTEGQ